jgi:hypothetical protein
VTLLVPTLVRVPTLTTWSGARRGSVHGWVPYGDEPSLTQLGDDVWVLDDQERAARGPVVQVEFRPHERPGEVRVSVRIRPVLARESQHA